MQFVGVKRFSPVIYGGDIPHKHDIYHYNYLEIPTTEKGYIKFIKDNDIIIDRKWWKKQYKRCIEGYTVENAITEGGDCYRDGIEAIWTKLGNDCFLPELDYTIKGRNVWISGRMYFYLNFWNIRRIDEKTKIKSIGPPRFTMLSWENWLIRDKSTKARKDLLWAKRRQMGASEESACDLAYDYLFLKDTQTAIVAGEDKYAAYTFNMCKRGIARLINTQFYKWSAISNSELLKSKYFGTEMHCRTAKNNEQVLSGLSPYKVLYEEGGIWQRGLLLSIIEFVNQSLEAEGIRTGQNVVISTAGDMDDGVADVETMFYNPDKYNLFKFKNIYEKDESSRATDVARFIPGWKFEVIDEEGNTLKQESIEKLKKDRESKDSKARLRAITMKPFHPSELFSSVKGGYFGEHIIHTLNERKAFIFTHQSLRTSYMADIEWVDQRDWSKGVDIKPNEDGVFFIGEEPEIDRNGLVYDNLYKAGVDSYDKDEANESNSKGSMHVFKGFRNASTTYKKFVARLVQRPKIEEGGAYTFYENTIKLSVAYNVVNLIEWSNIRIFDFYEKNGMQWILKERPDMVMSRYIMNTKTSNTYGIDPSTKPHWLAMLRDFLSVKENVYKLDDIEQITALAAFRYDPSGKKYNCDITISTALAIVCYEDETELEVIEKEDDFGEYQDVMVYKEINGILTRVRV